MSNIPINTSYTEYRQGAPETVLSTQKSFAQVVGRNDFPTKKDELIFPYVEGTQVKKDV